MTTYTAPLEDMMFLYEKLRNNKNYNEIEKYKEITPDLVKDILDEAAKINQNIILPLAKAGDESPAVLENGVVRTPPGYKEAYKKFTDDGWRECWGYAHENADVFELNLWIYRTGEEDTSADSETVVLKELIRELNECISTIIVFGFPGISINV